MVQMTKMLFSIAFVGTVSAVFAISFAAIIYTDDLAGYLDRGAGFALIGCTVLGVIGAFALSFRGSIVQIQDVPAILLAGAASSLIAQQQIGGEVLFATMVCLTALATCATGVISFAVGYFKLAGLARYIPYPVLAGFLAATGLLLFLGV